MAECLPDIPKDLSLILSTVEEQNQGINSNMCSVTKLRSSIRCPLSLHLLERTRPQTSLGLILAFRQMDPELAMNKGQFTFSNLDNRVPRENELKPTPQYHKAMTK